MTLQHSSRARGKIEVPDTPLPKLSRMDILQKTIREADLLIALHDLPTIIQKAKDVKARALAEIQELITGEPETVTEATAAVYGEYDLLNAEIIDGVSSPSWWNSITAEPY